MIKIKIMYFNMSYYVKQILINSFFNESAEI